jgi:hypothetical protein
MSKTHAWQTERGEKARAPGPVERFGITKLLKIKSLQATQGLAIVSELAWKSAAVREEITGRCVKIVLDMVLMTHGGHGP